MAHVLVTGASGFVGSHLCAALVEQNHDVRCLVRSTSSRDNLLPLGVEFIEGSVTSPTALQRAVEQIDVVYHLAGLITSLRSRDLFAVNAEGTANLVEACASLPTPPRLIYISSIAAAGPCRRDQLRVETDPPAPISHYGRSKAAGEAAVRKRADCLPATIVRPGIVIGPRDRLVLDIFKPIAQTGVHAMPGFGSTKLSMIHVEDLVNLLLLIVEAGQHLPRHDDPPRDPGAGVYFATADDHPSYRELGYRIATAMDRNVICLPIMPPIPWIAAGVSEAVARLRRQPTAFTIDKMREATVASWACSSAKARDELAFRMPQSLDERLRQTVQWYLENEWLKVSWAAFRRR